ncbi:MAG TPA: hypothetical protein VG265_10375 [Gaiellaceae bacterium]|nr:hypothetical protein [Gaiellaceae bacterium]
MIAASWTVTIDRRRARALQVRARGRGNGCGCSIELTFKGFQRLFEPLLRGKIVDEIEGNRGRKLKEALESP